jgi:hypothetical protein
MIAAQECATGFVFEEEVHTRDATLFAQVGFDFARSDHSFTCEKCTVKNIILSS